MSHDRLVLTLPLEPALARLTRLVTLHFLKQQGVKAGEARIRARSVETRARVALDRARRVARGAAGRKRKPAQPTPPAPLSITMVSRAKSCEVVVKPPRGASARLLLVTRTAESR